MRMVGQKAKSTVMGLKKKRGGDTPGRPEYIGTYWGWGGH